MKITNISAQMTRNTMTAETKGMNGAFADALKKASNEKNRDSVTISGQKPSVVSETVKEEKVYAPHAPNPNDPPVTIGAGLKSLTPEQRAELNEKYDMNNMRPNSTEFNDLMRDLRKMGVISDTPFFLHPNTTHFRWDSNGNFECTWRVLDDEPEQVVDWLNYSLNIGLEKYEDLLTKTLLSDEEKVFMNSYISQKNVLAVLQDIFGEQTEQE